MTPRNIAFAPGSPTPLLEKSEGKWNSIEPSSLGLPADLAKEAEAIWRHRREGTLSDEQLWEQCRDLGLRVLDVLGEGYNLHVFVNDTIRPVTRTVPA